MISGRNHHYLLITSIIAIVSITALLLLYRNLSTQDLIKQETRSNVEITRIFHNSIWPNYMRFVREVSNLPIQELKTRPEINQIRQDVINMMAGSNVVKVKIYDMHGLTVFSSDPTQIGHDASNNEAVQLAYSGVVSTNMTLRHRFDAFEKVIVDRNIVSSYIPIRLNKTEEVEGVFEIYSDVTGLLAHLSHTHNKIILITLGSLSGLLLLIFLIVHRADKESNKHVEEQHQHLKKLHYQTYHDVLTGLWNRTRFMEQLDEGIHSACRTEEILSVLFLDLDGFKLINDSLGHSNGDELLRIVAKKLASCLRPTDTLFRMGGDEFCIIQETLDTPEHAVHLAQRIHREMNEPVELHHQKIITTVSIGISLYPKDETNPEKLLQNADAAMYSSKQAGRNQYKFYAYEMNERAAQQLKFETNLKQALKRDEFILHYQPRVSSNDSHQVLAVEALIRWHNPYNEIIFPEKFIPELERSGLINSVGDWVLLEACRQNKAWQDAGHLPLRMSVNVSSIQFQSNNFAESVRYALDQSGLEPKYLEIELTENVLIDTSDRCFHMLNEIKSLGVFIAIDDFGTGYSSLSYLKSFPIDFIKIDRTFIKDLPSSKKDAAITSAIVSMAHKLDISLVAEGVASVECVDFLRDQHCEELQGFLFSEPVSADALIEYIHKTA